MCSFHVYITVWYIYMCIYISMSVGAPLCICVCVCVHACVNALGIWKLEVDIKNLLWSPSFLVLWVGTSNSELTYSALSPVSFQGCPDSLCLPGLQLQMKPIPTCICMDSRHLNFGHLAFTASTSTAEPYPGPFHLFLNNHFHYEAGNYVHSSWFLTHDLEVDIHPFRGKLSASPSSLQWLQQPTSETPT